MAEPEHCLPSRLSSGQSLSRDRLFATPWTAECQASLSITNSWSPLKLMSIKSVMPSNHLILCVPFSSCLQSFPASGSFPMSQLFAAGGRSIGVSASASVLLMNIQDWSPLQWTGWIPLQSKGLSRVFSNTAAQNINSSVLSFLDNPTLTSMHDYWKTIALTRWAFVGKVMSLLFNMLSRSVITFLPRSKRLLISWLQSPSAVILEPPNIKVCHCFHCFPIYLPGSDRTRCHDVSFVNVEF